MDNDKIYLACNMSNPTKFAAKGALAYVMDLNPGNAMESARVLLRSKGGRWIDVWVRGKNLANFRYKTIPPEHPRYKSSSPFDYSTSTPEVRERELAYARECLERLNKKENS